MSKTLVRAAKKAPEPSDEDKKSLNSMRKEARAYGATLQNDGEGGLPTDLALKVMRRDKFRCKKCGKRDNISLHHKGHLENPESAWLKSKAHSDDPNNIVVICGKCHDAIHEEDRAKE